MKKIILEVSLFFAFICILLVFAEIILQFKNNSMQNYDIEMWKYAKKLKTPSSNPILGHEHIPSSSAILQSVTIRTNELGMRGPSIKSLTEGRRRILVLGSSITLGWGVEENKVFSSRLQEMFSKDGQNVDVLNGGIGNYNAQRYVELFFTKLKELKPTDIVVHYFLRDAEVLEKGGGNWFLRNSELAVTMWVAWNRFFNTASHVSLEEHYKKFYNKDSQGYKAMEDSLKRLSIYAKQNKIRLYMAMQPDVHNLVNYKFNYIHDQMKDVAKKYGYIYIDLYPAFSGLKPQDVWAMPGDPHPNALGHEKMAEAVYPFLKDQR